MTAYNERLHKVEPCECESKQLRLCELFGKYNFVECLECHRYGPLADTKLEAVKSWNKKRLANEALEERKEKHVH